MANKFLDSNGVLYLWQKIKNMFVAKEDGKGLSSNDYTTEHKDAVADLIKNGVTAKNAVLYTAQTLTEEQKAQARENIGAGTGSDEGAVRYDAEQALTDEQKAQARENIGTTDGTWENMPDKPFYKTGWKYDIVADDKGETFTIEASDPPITFVKVGEPLTKEEVIDATAKIAFDGETEVMTVSQDMFVDFDEYTFVALNDYPIFAVSTQATAITTDESMGNVTIEIPSAGLWLCSMTTQSIEKDYTIKQINKEFLPDDIQSKNYVTPVLGLQLDNDNKGRLFNYYAVMRAIATGSSNSLEKGAVNINVDDFIVPFYLITQGTFNTEQELILSIVTSFDESGNVLSSKDVNLGVVPFQFEYNNEGTFIYELYVMKQADNTYIGRFKSIPSITKNDIGVANGVAALNSDGKVPSEQLPSYVDDVVEGYYNVNDSLFYNEPEFATVITGEKGKIYLDVSSSPAVSYRFGGTTFVPIASNDISPITNAEIDSILAS